MQQREVMSQLIEQDHIAQQDIETAMFVSQVYPPAPNWYGFLSKLLLCFGALAIACGVIFFVAANWQDMSRLIKFVLLQLLVVAPIIIYLRSKTHTLLSQISLTSAFILLGALMAYFGQTYQTGADPWQLFFNWALLGLPWVIISRFSPLWMMFLALLNLSLVLYHDALGTLLPFGINRDESLFWCLLSLNYLSLIMWELCRVNYAWLNQSWAGRLLAIATIFCANALALMAIFSYNTSWLGGAVWVFLMVMTYVVYRKIRPDLFMLALGCLSGVVIVVGWSANILKHIDDGNMFILLFLLTIGLTSAAAVWLKKLMKEFQ
ncbi:DUF2157 domain-containing protein [Paraglaciecola hydrolytica]|uniref:DUF2157 domain-containing protein n=1 Tax=Paraglaciecola hydrolytica TaxID=1799789 RepID=A0A136A496_9ALTE|nr:DUF2157 domain-containing protein [Paraglaciecola hydrolytica]KXI30068.1 hypothetical protein AX660_08690 [Paraglaciecola hydrolytica]